MFELRGCFTSLSLSCFHWRLCSVLKTIFNFFNYKLLPGAGSKQIHGKIKAKKIIFAQQLLDIRSVLFDGCCRCLCVCVSHKGNKVAAHSWKVRKLTGDDNMIFSPINTAENKQMGKQNKKKTAAAKQIKRFYCICAN